MNKIIAIGGIGDFRCYLNISKEEAIKRYKSSDRYDERYPPHISIFEFMEEFGAYEVYPHDSKNHLLFEKLI